MKADNFSQTPMRIFLNGHLEVIKWLYDHGGKDDNMKANNIKNNV